MVKDERFVFRVGPLHSDTKYSVSTEKEGYILTASTQGSFKAFKLGEIIVKVRYWPSELCSGMTDDWPIWQFPSYMSFRSVGNSFYGQIAFKWLMAVHIRFWIMYQMTVDAILWLFNFG